MFTKAIVSIAVVASGAAAASKKTDGPTNFGKFKESTLQHTAGHHVKDTEEKPKGKAEKGKGKAKAGGRKNKNGQKFKKNFNLLRNRDAKDRTDAEVVLFSLPVDRDYIATPGRHHENTHQNTEGDPDARKKIVEEEEVEINE